VSDVVVVGHGVVGRGMGSKIDKHIVCRFNGWYEWQNPDDYGVRSDYCVAHKNYCDKIRADNTIIFNAIDRNCYSHKYLEILRGCPEAVCDIGTPMPSKGMVAALTMIDVVKPRSLILLGCDALWNGYIGEVHYPSQYNVIAPFPHGMADMVRFVGKNYDWRHDYRVEGQIIREYCDNHNVKLYNADDIF